MNKDGIALQDSEQKKAGSIQDFAKDEISKWLKSLISVIKKNPVRNVLVLGITVYVMFFLAQMILQSLGIVTCLGFILSCLYGLSKAIEKPGLPFFWCVGFYIAATVSDLIWRQVVPQVISIGQQPILPSILSLFVLLYVVVVLKDKADGFKRMGHQNG